MLIFIESYQIAFDDWVNYEVFYLVDLFAFVFSSYLSKKKKVSPTQNERTNRNLIVNHINRDIWILVFMNEK